MKRVMSAVVFAALLCSAVVLASESGEKASCCKAGASCCKTAECCKTKAAGCCKKDAECCKKDAECCKKQSAECCAPADSDKK